MDELQLEHADLMIQKLKDDLLSLRSNPELVANQRNSIARDYFNERDKNVKLVAAATPMADALEELARLLKRDGLSARPETIDDWRAAWYKSGQAFATWKKAASDA